jgi:hypothetical protein
MTFTEALKQIPVMLYVCLVLFPVILTVYFMTGKQRRARPLRSVDPLQVLQERNVNVSRASLTDFLLGSLFGIGASVLIFFVMIGVDWYNSRGIFAADLPFNTYPPASIDSFPPHPPSFAKSDAPATKDNSTDSNSQSGQ